MTDTTNTLRRVLFVAPGVEPFELRIVDELDSLRALCGGDIEGWTLKSEGDGSGVSLICHGEGKLFGLPPNRPLPNLGRLVAPLDFVCGNFVVTAHDNEGETRDLTNDEVERFALLFALEPRS